MESNAKNLREFVKLKKQEYDDVAGKLRNYEDNCRHNFSEVIYDPVYHKGYTIPAVSLGVDSTPEMYVPAISEDRWKRECTRCGLVEYTTSVDEETIIKKTPKFFGRIK
jgi:hypothetical protein